MPTYVLTESVPVRIGTGPLVARVEQLVDIGELALEVRANDGGDVRTLAPNTSTLVIPAVAGPLRLVARTPHGAALPVGARATISLASEGDPTAIDTVTAEPFDLAGLHERELFDIDIVDGAVEVRLVPRRGDVGALGATAGASAVAARRLLGSPVDRADATAPVLIEFDHSRSMARALDDEDARALIETILGVVEAAAPESPVSAALITEATLEIDASRRELADAFVAERRRTRSMVGRPDWAGSRPGGEIRIVVTDTVPGGEVGDGMRLILVGDRDAFVARDPSLADAMIIPFSPSGDLTSLVPALLGVWTTPDSTKGSS